VAVTLSPFGLFSSLRMHIEEPRSVILRFVDELKVHVVLEDTHSEVAEV